MRVGVLSDTHVPAIVGALPAVIQDIFKGVDLILHAGDLSVPEVIDWLERLAPVLAVSGGGTALALWLEEEAIAVAECAPIAALPGMAALLYWFNHLVFKAAMPRREDLATKPARRVTKTSPPPRRDRP